MKVVIIVEGKLIFTPEAFLIEFSGLHGRLNTSVEKMKSSCSEDLYNLILDEDEDEFSIFEVRALKVIIYF